MSDLVIAVGGGGQHVALALSRLVFLGALRSGARAFVIDADNSSRLARDLATFGDTLKWGWPHPLTGDVKEQLVVPPFSRDQRENTSFRSLFVDRGHPAERELFEAFYDEASGGNERGDAGVDVGKGMFANPSVGSAVFASSKGKNGAMDPLFGQARTASRIFVVGSFLGGTGAGIMHQLVRLVHQSVDDKLRAQLFGSFLLRWFTLPPEQGRTVDPETLLASEGHGLEYFYRYTKQLLAASLLLGAPESPPDNVVRPAVAPGDNGEMPSAYPLLCAYGMIMLPEKTDTQGAMEHKTYGLAHNTQNPLWPVKELKWNDQLDPPSRDHTLGARWLEAKLFLRLCESFARKRGDFEGFDYSNARRTWGSLIIPAAKSMGDNQSRFAARVLDALFARAHQYRFCDGWLHQIFGDIDLSSSNGDPKAQHLYQDLRNRRWDEPHAFDILADAFQHQDRVVPNPKLGPEHQIAERIEKSLLAVLRRN